MMSFKRLLSLLALFGGLLGMVVCLVGIAAVWTTGSRLSRLNDLVFERIDRSLVAVRERVVGAQRRTHELKVTTEDIGQTLGDWAKQKTRQRLVTQLNLEERTERLGLGLQRADNYIELAEVTVEGVQQAVEFGRAVGVPLDAASVDLLHEQLGSLRSPLKQAAETVTGMREGAARITAGEPPAERLKQVVQLALRGVATLGEIDVRLGRVAASISETQAKFEHLRSKLHAWILAGQLGATLVIAWFAAGQVFLCVHSWKCCRGGMSPA